MKAKATQIGKSAKETITLDGETILKSVTRGRWSYLIKITVVSGLMRRGEFVGKSASKENAEKWTPFEMCEDSYHPSCLPLRHREDFARRYIEAIARGAKVIQKGNTILAREPLEFTREIVEIER